VARMPDRDSIADALRLHGGVLARAARALEVDRRRLSEAVNADDELAQVARGARKLADDEAAERVEVRADGVRIDSTNLAALADPDGLMRRRGIDPDDWTVTAASMTEWGRDPDTGEPFQRLKVDVRRRLELANLLVPEPLAPVRPPAPATATDRPRVGFLVSDFHAPYHDEGLLACFIAMCDDVRFDFGVFAGDTIDLPTPSRHRRNLAWDATPQACIRSGYSDILAPVRDVLPDADLELVVGNHDVRLRNWLLEREPALADLCPGDSDVPALSMRNLLALDKLHIRANEPLGEYGDSSVVVCRNLAVTHGERTGKYNAVDDELASYGHSIAFGHTHRKRTAYMTRWDMDGASCHVGVNLGCMCVIEGGLGYYRRPNWQQGFGVVTVWPDGRFHIEHADYVNGSLMWRDRRYDAP
jgi:predicted phosphodiesterase